MELAEHDISIESIRIMAEDCKKGIVKKEIKTENIDFDGDCSSATDEGTEDTYMVEEKPNIANTTDAGIYEINNPNCHKILTLTNKGICEENELLHHVKDEIVDDDYEETELLHHVKNEIVDDNYEEKKPLHKVKDEIVVDDNCGEKELLRCTQHKEILLEHNYFVKEKAVEGKLCFNIRNLFLNSTIYFFTPCRWLSVLDRF